ncbi:MAG: polysaccharide deacetylase family protein [Selenomonadaceae bacterium]|nr:polysaccharide deacetylase family protein [Selenomonadaceae bacterium]
MVLFGAGYLYLTPTPQGFPILEYHMVCSGEIEPEETAYNVPPEDFREELAYLQREGYTTISLLEYMKAKRGKLTLPEKPIVLTFDDGYADNYYEMLPIIEEYGMKATVYMVTNNIGQPRYLTWDELRDMQRRGIEIGSHTANHIPLTALSPEDRRDEVYLSKLLMEWNGIDTVFSLSYPNGAYDDTLPELLKENEYLTAVTGDGGLNTMETNPYLLQRVNIPCPHFGLTEFKFRLWKAEAMAKLGIWQHRER